MMLVNNRTTNGVTPARMQVVAELPIEGVESCTRVLPKHEQTSNSSNKSVLTMYVYVRVTVYVCVYIYFLIYCTIA
jgi:hypothetical protein